MDNSHNYMYFAIKIFDKIVKYKFKYIVLYTNLMQIFILLMRRGKFATPCSL